MKKLFYLLTVLLMTSPFKSGMFARKHDDHDETFTDPLLIGKHINTSQAVASARVYKYGITNFFIIGDSLSDVDGLTTYMHDRFAKINIDLVLKMDGVAYGFDNNHQHHNAFSNGPTAGWLVAQQLGLKNFHAANKFSSNDNGFGHNYAVAGATAGKLSGGSGLLLNDVRADVQAQTLITHHVIGAKDVVLLAIGGNDLMTLIKLNSDPKAQAAFLQDSINRLRTTFFTLLNHHIYHILFMTPPKIDFPPMHQAVFQDQTQQAAKEAMLAICAQFYDKITQLLAEVARYYPDQVTVFDLFNYATQLEKRWLPKWWWNPTRKNKIANLRKNATSWDELDLELLLGDEVMKVLNMRELTLKIPQVIRNIRKYNNTLTIHLTSGPVWHHQEIDDFFFVDKLHPNHRVHKIVAKILMQKLRKIK